jgi:predicted RecB family nuclease
VWSIADYIEATETGDEAPRQKFMGDILKYNKEDLAATWNVLGWVKSFGTGMTAA